MRLNVKNAGKSIRGIQVLRDIDLELCGGRVYGLTGPNGSGKTMLLRLMCGMIRPTVGYVEIDGRRLGRDLDFPPSVGLLIDGPGFPGGYTGYGNLSLLASIRGVAGPEEIRRALHDVGLEPEDRRKYRKYSLGMKQRLGIAAATMERPELLLLDEPANALDTDGVQLLRGIIRRERERGALIVLSGHDRGFLTGLADSLLIMEEGRCRDTGI